MAKTTFKQKFLTVSFFIVLGLSIVGADQVGHYLQTHRDGYVASTK